MTFKQHNLMVDERNRLKTNNHMGFAHITPLKATQELYKLAREQKGIYGDIGAAYGVDTLQLLEEGARVVAIDLDQSHLDILKDQLNEEQLSRLDIRCQRFPEEVHLEKDSYDGLLLSRILIFLTPENLDTALTHVYQALKPGGRVFIITVSPFSEKWDGVASAFKEHKKILPKEPFYVTNLWDLVPFTQAFLPPAIQLFDQKSLMNVLEKVGFSIIECNYESHHGTQDVYAIAQKKP